MKHPGRLIFGLAVLLFTALIIPDAGCRRQAGTILSEEIDSISITWVPDFHEGIFEARLNSPDNVLILKGETNIQEAKDGLTGLLKKRGISFIDSMTVLPDTNIIKKPWGIVTVSVCNIRSDKSFDAEMVSQALMGTPVKILKDEDGWSLIQTPDMYLGWVDNEAIESKSTEEFNEWKASPRLFYIKKTGDIFADAGRNKVVSDIVAGCIVENDGESGRFYKVQLPDGRKGFVQSDQAISFEQLTPDKYFTAENLLSTAGSFMGIPYLWGGTSAKGFDCSGFVKTVYFLNGIILSRDAAQQFQHGIRIRRSFYPDSLRPGDLLFFGSHRFGRPRPTHVGMYIGNTEFIHASGMVRVSSLDSTRSNFSRLRRDSFLGIRRIMGAPYGKGIEPVIGHSWYK